jgi:hypothetical protein
MRPWLVLAYALALSLAAAPSPAQTPPPPVAATAASTERDGSHDFDFEFGSWKAHLRRLVHPLTGSTTWVEYDGTSVVRKVWNGRANLGELKLDGPAGGIEGLSLRLYDPATHQWSVSWANANGGGLTTPLIGGFNDGRGEFYDQDTLGGRSIYARFIFSDITPSSFQIVQSFSADGGATWEPNWISTFTRTAQ